jgi:hypothetical protein
MTCGAFYGDVIAEIRVNNVYVAVMFTDINKIHSSRLLLFTGNKRSPYRQQ